MATFAYVVTSTIPRAFETAIAMGFAVDEQDDVFSVLMEGVEAEVGSWDAGFAAFGAAYMCGGETQRLADLLAARLREIMTSLAEGGAALVVSHSGMIEAAAVGCLPQADHAVWGSYCDYCEGVRLGFEDGQFSAAQILRIEKE